MFVVKKQVYNVIGAYLMMKYFYYIHINFYKIIFSTINYFFKLGVLVSSFHYLQITETTPIIKVYVI